MSRPSQKQLGVLVAGLALALPAAHRFGGLTLPPGALGLPRRRVRIFAPALIPHASEEQDLSGSAVTRGHATGTVRGPEMDDVVQWGPLENRSIVCDRL